jgi:hypothetical protein
MFFTREKSQNIEGFRQECPKCGTGENRRLVATRFRQRSLRFLHAPGSGSINAVPLKEQVCYEKENHKEQVCYEKESQTIVFVILLSRTKLFADIVIERMDVRGHKMWGGERGGRFCFLPVKQTQSKRVFYRQAFYCGQ